MRLRRFTGLVALVVALATSARADYLEVKRHTFVRQSPNGGAAAVAEMQPGALLALVADAQTNGYYRVNGAPGNGWIYRTMVRRRAGSLPGPNAIGPTDPGAPTPSPGFTTGVFTTGDGKHCPPEGDGGDPDLNRLKNRDRPPPTFADMTVDAFLEEVAADAADMGRTKRAKWTPEALAEVAALEGKGVRVEGFLLMVKKEDEESCNCHSKTDVDRHMWLAEESGTKDDRDEAMVVEASPRLLPLHPGWTDARLKQLATSQTRVRISGWVMWDQEHPEQLGKTRGTLWEIHPIHKIEFLDGTQWKSIDN